MGHCCGFTNIAVLQYSRIIAQHMLFIRKSEIFCTSLVKSSSLVGNDLHRLSLSFNSLQIIICASCLTGPQPADIFEEGQNGCNFLFLWSKHDWKFRKGAFALLLKPWLRAWRLTRLKEARKGNGFPKGTASNQSVCDFWLALPLTFWGKVALQNCVLLDTLC